MDISDQHSHNKYSLGLRGGQSKSSSNQTEHFEEAVSKLQQSQDYYDVLTLPKTCSQDEIKAAYEELCQALHPDTTPVATACAGFKLVQEAYQCLSQDFARRQYDEHPHHGTLAARLAELKSASRSPPTHCPLAIVKCHTQQQRLGLISFMGLDSEDKLSDLASRVEFRIGVETDNISQPATPTMARMVGEAWEKRQGAFLRFPATKNGLCIMMVRYKRKARFFKGPFKLTITEVTSDPRGAGGENSSVCYEVSATSMPLREVCAAPDGLRTLACTRELRDVVAEVKSLLQRME